MYELTVGIFLSRVPGFLFSASRRSNDKSLKKTHDLNIIIHDHAFSTLKLLTDDDISTRKRKIFDITRSLRGEPEKR
jgi:hypothetical protein